jgi:lipopolysaccharide export system permease protein
MPPRDDRPERKAKGTVGFGVLNIDRYLRRSVLRPFAAIVGVLVALFAGYSLSGILADAVSGLLSIGVIAALAGLKLLIALEVLTPISLFVAVVVAFGRLQEDGELTIMLALGMSPLRLARPVIMLALTLAVLVSCLSLFARPWAYAESHAITQRASNMLNLNAMEAGTFYASRDGGQVIFLASRPDPHGPAQGVFVARRKDNGQVEVIYARSALPEVTDAGGQRSVYLSDAHIYDLDTQNPTNDRVLEAGGVSINPDGPRPGVPGYSPVAARTLHLATSRSPADIAELQWRLSTGVSTLLLALLGMSLSWGRPRQSRYAKFGPAILAYSAYYLLCTVARTWVEHGRVGPFPGLWWAPATLALTLVAIWIMRLAPGRSWVGRAQWGDPLRTVDLASGQEP